MLKVWWNHRSTLWLDFYPLGKKGRIKWFSVHFCGYSSRTQSLFWSSIRQWNTKLMDRTRSSLSLHCRRIQRPGSQQLEESGPISLSQECRGLTTEGAWARDLTKHRQKWHAQPERHLSQSSESNQAQFFPSLETLFIITARLTMWHLSCRGLLHLTTKPFRPAHTRSQLNKHGNQRRLIISQHESD